ncbi:unnamed protein product [Brassica napus]|uniref:(rape) hypothetical protein n=1 Tax=Brassica napus TaxID=3708 RepID=A0A816XX52_BRANA|nr:unnamed protein product [Brassica napus]
MVLQVEEEGLDEYDEDGEKESQPRWSVHARGGSRIKYNWGHTHYFTIHIS